MTHEQKILMIVWFVSMGIWAFFAIRATLRYEEKERKKFEAFMRRMKS
jgi:hypothetical protein